MSDEKLYISQFDGDTVQHGCVEFIVHDGGLVYGGFIRYGGFISYACVSAQIFSVSFAAKSCELCEFVSLTVFLILLST